MKSLRAPDRCSARAIRVAKVKFVMLPPECALETAAGAVETSVAVAPVQTRTRPLSSTLRAFVSRVIGRL